MLLGTYCNASAIDADVIFICTKTNWSTVGSDRGEALGTVTLTNGTLDHFEGEIRCDEDKDQYISLANAMSNGSTIYCYCWEGGSYPLNSGYHYTITIKAFDVPYYGAKPVATTTYKFVGTGNMATPYNDNIQLTKVDLEPNSLIMNGYNINGMSFDITFSAPVSAVSSWWAKGYDGTEMLTAVKKKGDGTVWTINLSSDILSAEGSANIQIQAWDAEGIQLRGDNGDHAFAINIVISDTSPTGISRISANDGHRQSATYSITGQRTPGSAKGVIISNGKKVLK